MLSVSFAAATVVHMVSSTLFSRDLRAVYALRVLVDHAPFIMPPGDATGGRRGIRRSDHGVQLGAHIGPPLRALLFAHRRIHGTLIDFNCLVLAHDLLPIGSID